MSPRIAPSRFASLKLAPGKKEPVKSAAFKLAPVRFASLKLALIKSAPARFPPARLAPVSSASFKLALVKSAPARSAPDVGYQIVNLSIQQRLPGVVALKIHQPKAKAPPRQVGSRQ